MGLEDEEAAEKEIGLLTKMLDIYKKQAQKDTKYLKDVAWAYDGKSLAVFLYKVFP